MGVAVRKISEGAEAVIYAARMLGRNVIVKERVAKGYRIKELDEQLRRQRTKTEAKIQSTLYEKGVRVPGVILVGKYFVVMERVQGKTLNRMAGVGKAHDRMSMGMAMAEAGRVLGTIHRLGVSHGDFTTANIMQDRSGRLWVIDFGLAAFTNSEEEMALDVLLMKRSVDSGMYERFIKSYKLGFGGKASAVLGRLGEIEKRGRYQTRTLDSA